MKNSIRPLCPKDSDWSLRYFLLLFFLVNSLWSQAQTPMYSKAGGTISNTVPFNNTLLKLQQIYLASDITTSPTSGYINRIYFRGVTASASATFSNLSVKLGQTTATVFSGGNTFFTGLTSVYSAATTTLTSASVAGNWFYLDLQNSFSYNLSQTLILEITFTAKTAGGINLYASTCPGAPNHKRLHATTTTATTGTANLTWNDIGIDVSNTAICTTPVTQATSLSLTPQSTTQINGSFTAASGADAYLVVQYPSGAATTSPVNGITYSAGATLGLGTVVSADVGTTFSSTNLAGSTSYDYYVYTYNFNCVNGPNYNLTSPLTSSASTLSCSTITSTLSASATPSTICQGASISISASGASNYSWQPGGASGASITVSPASTSTYTVTGTISGCPFTATALVNVNPQPNVVIQSEVASYPCGSQLGSTTLTASGGNSYAWQPNGATTASITVSPISASIYKVTATGSNGCTKTRSKVIQKASSNVKILTDAPPAGVVFGDVVNFKALGANTYQWQPPGHTFSSFSSQLYSTTTYTLTGSYPNCSIKPTAFKSIVVNQNLRAPSYKYSAGTPQLTSENSSEKNQYLYLPSDISPTPSSGLIHRLYFYTESGGSSAQYTNLTIKLGQSSATTFSGGTTFFTGLTTVFSSPTVTLYSAYYNNNWTYVDLPTPFTYNASQTLIVEISHSALSGSLTLLSGISPNSPIHRRLVTTNLTSTTGTTNLAWLYLGFDIVPITTCTAPPDQASLLDLTSVSATNIDVSFVAAPSNPSGYLVVRYPEGATETPPVDGVTYNLNSMLGLGIVKSVGIKTWFSDFPLSYETGYDYYVYTYNNKCVGSPAYNTVNPLKMTENTKACVNTPFNSSISISNPDICAGGSSMLVNSTAISGANVYSYWMPGGMTQQSIIVSPTTTTTYTLIATKDNSYGCKDTGINTITVNVLPPPTVSISASSNTICPGNSTTLIASGATYYSWQPGGATTASITVSPGTTTTYTVTGSNPGCPVNSTATTTINVSPPLAISIAVSNSTACGATLTASGANSYFWHPGGATTASIDVNPNASTTFTVTGTSTFGCIGSQTKFVQITAPQITVNASSNLACPGQSISLTASGASNYNWQPGGATTSSITINPMSTSTYSVTGTSTSGCTVTQTKDVEVKSIACTASPTSLCVDATTNLNAIANFTFPENNFYGNNMATIPGTGTIGQASPFPLIISVSGLPTSGVSLQSVFLNGLLHDFPEDIDIWLESPGGQIVMLMSNVGGTDPVFVNLSIEDGQPTIPGWQILDGIYSPTDWYLGGINEPSNASLTLSSFTGNLNGDWKLYIQDDEIYHSGSLGSFSLKFRTGSVLWTASNTSTINIPTNLNTSSVVKGNTTYTVVVNDGSGCSVSNSTSVSVIPCNASASIKVLLQGYYIGSNLMQAALMNQAIGNNTNLCDSVQVTLYDPISLASVASAVVPLETNGNISIAFSILYDNYYMSVKHRNSIEVWSATPLYFSDAYMNYVFYDQASKAYGANQVQVEPGVYALYSGDINQDGFVDSFDYPALDTDIFNGVNGVYVNTDLNGDGFVDSFDYPVFDTNSSNGVSAITP